MPHSNPVPPLGPLKKRFFRIMRLAALFSAAIAAIAVLLVAYGDPEFHLHMMIATALGVGLSVWLGTALMTLVFLSNSSGHDADAADHQHKDDHDIRP